MSVSLTARLKPNGFRRNCGWADHQPLDFGWLKQLTLPTAELIAEAQTDGSGTTHRYGFVPLPVVRIQLRPRVGQVLSVDLHEPRVLSDTERPIISCECRQVISSGVALQVKRKLLVAARECD